MTLKYDYSDVANFCQYHGMSFDLSQVEEADRYFDQAEFSQRQVNIAMRLHAWRVKHLFNPAIYGFKDRVKLALHFLFG